MTEVFNSFIHYFGSNSVVISKNTLLLFLSCVSSVTFLDCSHITRYKKARLISNYDKYSLWHHTHFFNIVYTEFFSHTNKFTLPDAKWGHRSYLQLTALTKNSDRSMHDQLPSNKFSIHVGRSINYIKPDTVAWKQDQRQSKMDRRKDSSETWQSASTAAA
jgi:hypothetical protein